MKPDILDSFLRKNSDDEQHDKSNQYTVPDFKDVH